MGFRKLLLLSLILVFCLSNLSIHTLANVSSNNITLLGDSILLDNGMICLTPEYKSSLSSSSFTQLGVGRAIFTHPIRLVDHVSKSNSSFEFKFSFYINPFSHSSIFGDGLSLLITSNPYSVGHGLGYLGLSGQTPTEEEEYYVAVEFDTSFNPGLGDSSGNHIGIDINSIMSVDTEDAGTKFNLKNGRRTTIWVEYIDSKKKLKVWLSYTRSRTIRPILAYDIDLSLYLEEYMFVGFSASGDAQHVIESWRFRSYGFLPNPNSFDTMFDGGCVSCVPEDISKCSVGVAADDDEKDGKGSAGHDSGKGSSGEVVKPASKIFVLEVGVGAASVLLSLVLVIAAFVWWYFYRNKNYVRLVENRIAVYEPQVAQVPTIVPLVEVERATGSFNPDSVLTRGVSGTLYGGRLSSGKEVTVKRFYRFNTDDLYCGEVAGDLVSELGLLKHKNLLQLQYWCCEQGQLLLVYDYMANGSLDKLLERTAVKWEHMQRIVLGVSSALRYLHEECERRIIHRDVKACNIMVDAEFNAKLGDYGLAGLYQEGAGEVDIPAGVRGYLAPEMNPGVPTTKTDIYSFGVVVLEVATGKKAVVDSDGKTLVDWVREKLNEGKLLEAADARLIGAFDRNEMERMLKVGLLCAASDCASRPTAKEAARMIEGEAPLPVLPAPSSHGGTLFGWTFG